MNKCEICNIKTKCENYMKVNGDNLCDYINEKFIKESKEKGIILSEILSISDLITYQTYRKISIDSIFNKIEKVSIKEFNKIIGFKDVKGGKSANKNK